MSIALALGPGALYGAYGAGVTTELGRQLKPEYFSSVYASSVGVFAATFFAAGQYEIGEKAWRHYVHGRQLINFFRIWNILKLCHLEEIFQDERALLDIDRLFRSGIRLTYVLTKLKDGGAVYRIPTHEDIFECMRASSATPLLHPPVRIGDELFFDGAFSDPLPVAKAFEDGAQFIVAVSNKWADFQMPMSFSAFGAACRVKSRIMSRLVHGYEALLHEKEERAQRDPRVLLIRPSRPLPLKSSVDTDARRINATVDLGIKDARSALELLRRLYNY